MKLLGILSVEVNYIYLLNTYYITAYNYWLAIDPRQSLKKECSKIKMEKIEGIDWCISIDVWLSTSQNLLFLIELHNYTPRCEIKDPYK